MAPASGTVLARRPVVVERPADAPASSAAVVTPKRIAYLVNQYPAVSHTFIRREIAALEMQGIIEIERFSLRRNQNLVDPADRAEAAKTTVVLDQGLLSLGVSIVSLALGSPRRFLRALLLALRVGWGSDRGLLRHFAYFGEACVLLRLLRDGNIEHVHAHFGTNATVVAMLCRVLGGPPYSFTIHGPLEFDLAPKLGLRDKIAGAAFVVAITSYCRSQIWRLCTEAQRAKVHVVTCGVDASFLAQEPAPIPEAPRLVFVGRLSEHKAPRLLVEAAARLAREGVAFELLFAGDGELRVGIDADIARHGLADQVKITGFVDEAGVRGHLRNARALILPSFAEGLPVVIMEAFALGRPVVSTFVAGIPELVEPGKSGWLVPAGSVEHLAGALREVLACPTERLEAMGRAGRARVIEQHDVRASGHRLARLLSGAR